MVEQDAPTVTLTLTVEAAILAAAAQSGGVFRIPEGPALVAAAGHCVSLTRILAVLDEMEAHGAALHLERGAHVIPDPIGRVSTLAVGSHLVGLGYISLWTATDHYGLTTQDVSGVSVVTPERKRPIDSPALNARFVFHRTSSERIFGWHEEAIDGTVARIADIERVLIDLVWFTGREGVPDAFQVLAIWEAAAATANPYVLVDYAQRMGSTLLERRIGYLMDRFAIGPTDALLGWRAKDRRDIRVFRFGAVGLPASERWGVA
jgi:predicted transcriptional regulator of viral defense system